MVQRPLTILVTGATGSIGRHVVEEAASAGHNVRALARNPATLTRIPRINVVTGDLTKPDTLLGAVNGIDAIVFAHGTYGSIEQAARVDYGGVRNVLDVLAARPVRIALMTAIGVTDRKGAHDWKRRAERMVRTSGHPFTIVRPGWFDYNDRDQCRLVFLQGDKRQTGTPRDGVVARRQVAEVLVRSLTSDAAARKTLELIAERGPAQTDLEPLFAALDPDAPGDLDAVHDAANMPIEQEPPEVIQAMS